MADIFGAKISISYWFQKGDVWWAGLASSSSDVDRQSADTGSKSGLFFSKQCVQFCEIQTIW